MRFVKIILKFIAGLVLVIFALLASMITTPDQTPLEQSTYYSDWKGIVSQATIKSVTGNDTLYAGWARVNFTPDTPGPLAGYGKRRGRPYEQVHDSVYVRAVVLQKGSTRAAIVSADLLIIPPTVTERLKEMLTSDDIAFEHIYLGATHTHNSVGGWGTGISGLFFSGPYNPAVEVQIAEAIVESIRKASGYLAPVSLTYREALGNGLIKNRLVGDKGRIDPEIRAFELTRQDQQKLTFTSFGAHSTVLSSRTMQLSRDWPGVLIDSLDRESGNFGMYMAGAVGSMAPIEVGETDLIAMANEGNRVYQALKKGIYDSTLVRPVLTPLTLPLPLGDPRPRLTDDWALRSWVFKRAFGEFPNNVKALRLGNILLIGVPCDFSGELMEEIDRYAKTRGLNLIVTSFNGGYMGYVTDDRWYDLDEYETVTMNWFGPYKGTYFKEVIKDLVELLD